jgi:hypothetical protein
MKKYIAGVPFGWDSGIFEADNDEAACAEASRRFAADHPDWTGGTAIFEVFDDEGDHSIPSRGPVDPDAAILMSYGYDPA